MTSIFDIGRPRPSKKPCPCCAGPQTLCMGWPIPRITCDRCGCVQYLNRWQGATVCFRRMCTELHAQQAIDVEARLRRTYPGHPEARPVRVLSHSGQDRV